jgi:serine/threonine protein kinase
VDIWSIGCILRVLISSDPVISGQELQKQDASLVSGYGAYVAFLSGNEAWSRISEAARSFIKGCLTIDEMARLTASAALQHEWFTHEDYREDFDAAYQRAIQGWRPRQRGKGELLVETLDGFNQHSARIGSVALLPKRQSAYENRSQHFAQNQLSARPTHKTVCRVQKPLPRASVVMRGARSPSERIHHQQQQQQPGRNAGIFASSIPSRSWRPL